MKTAKPAGDDTGLPESPTYWFALDDRGRLRVPLFGSERDGMLARVNHWGMHLFQPPKGKKMESLKRIISIFITLKRIASVFLLLTLLIVGLSAQERRQDSPPQPSARTSRPEVENSRLAGTYRLNSARSDNARAAVYGATNSLPEVDQLLILGGLMSRLESPDMLIIEQRGYAVTIASPNAPSVTFNADGRERSEIVADGRTVRARSTLSGGRLVVSSKGDRGSDFDVTFESRDEGRGLDVTRRIYADQYTQPIIVHSFYDRTPDAAGNNR